MCTNFHLIFLAFPKMMGDVKQKIGINFVAEFCRRYIGWCTLCQRKLQLTGGNNALIKNSYMLKASAS